jgi:ABC-2 type transport system permease protein
MLNDLITVLRKELLEILMPDGRFQGGARNVAVLVAIAGVLFPLQAGAGWLSSWASVYSACFPAILLVNYGADAFAGERERHTLETLLATRLPDGAILFGKVAAIAVYGWGLILSAQVVAVVTLTLVHGHGRLLFFAPGVLAAVVTIGLLLPLLVATVATLVSMTAPTARAAGQRMLLPFLAIYGLPALLPVVARQVPWLTPMLALTPGQLTEISALVCLLASAAAAWAALRLFRRERLVLA